MQGGDKNADQGKDKGADQAVDSTPADLSPDLAPDLSPDLTLDLSPDLTPDLTPDLAPPIDGPTPDQSQPDKGGCTVVGSTCNDNNACTHTDKCQTGGACKGTLYDCNDLIGCTIDTCLGKPPAQGGCKNEVSSGNCHIKGVCHKTGDTSGTCAVCDPSFSQFAWAPKKGNNCVVTLAGNGAGYINGPLAGAKFKNPTGITVDSSGVIYVADWLNHRIRKIHKGAVSTFAGSGTSGNKDGPVATAQFINPYDVDVDSASGTVYVAQVGGNSVNQGASIRAISGGKVTTFAGGGTIFVKDGPKSAWKFWKPQAVTVGLQGRVYASDTWHHIVVEIWGTKITLLGGRRNSKEDAGVMGFKDGTPGLAQFQYPRGLALGQGGVLLVADRGNGALRKIGPGGVTTEKTGFGGPEDVVADLTSGRVFIADGSSARIRVLEKSGTLSTLAGTGSVGTTDGPGSTAQFKDPAGLALDKNGYLYVAERGNSRIRVINPN